MIETILGWVETSSWVAVVGASVWGVASVALSPCHLTSLPLLVGFLGRIEGQRSNDRRLALWVTLGVSLSLVAVAGVSLAAGRILGDLWGIGPWLMVAFLVGAGLVLLEAIDLPSLGGLKPERARAGAAGAVTAGGVLGLTLGPCTFAFFAPVLAFGAGTAPAALRFGALVAFVAGHLLSSWAVGIVGARVGGWVQRGGRLARVTKAVVGLGAIGVAVDMILTTP